jgi:Transposase DDE domain
VLAHLDALVTALYVRVDDLLPKRSGPGRPPRITDAELIALAVAQMLLGLPNDRRFLALARHRLAHLFPYLPQQPAYNKRLRALAPTIAQVIAHLAVGSPSFCDNLRLLDSTPVPCGQSRETARRSELAGHAAYGYCRSHSRYFWGFRLYLLCAPDGMPIAFELAPANAPERHVAAEMLERVDLTGYTVMADKGFAGEEFEQHMAALGARFLRPDRKCEPTRHGALGGVRQWVESVFWTCKGQLTLEQHGGRTLEGLCVRVALRLLALAAGLVHNQQIGDPGRHFAAYGH